MDRPATVTDENGRITTQTYDTLGHLSAATDPLGNQTRFAYDSRGWMTGRTDPRMLMAKGANERVNLSESPGMLFALSSMREMTGANC